MRVHPRRRAVAGVAIMLVALLLGLTIFFLADLRRAWEDRLTLYAVIDAAPRLRVGSPVWISGHQVGQVRAISFMPVGDSSASALAVQFEIPGAQQSMVRRGSSLRVRPARLIGESVIDITPGPATSPPLLSGDTLFAHGESERRNFSLSLHAFQGSLDALLESSRNLGSTVDRRSTQFVLLSRQIENVQHEFNAMRANFAAAPIHDAALQSSLAAIANTAGQLGPALQRAADRFQDPTLQKSVQRLQQHSDSLAGHLAQIRARLAQSSLTRFAQDSALLRTLHQAQIQLDSLVTQTRRQPLRYWQGDKRALGNERGRSK